MYVLQNQMPTKVIVLVSEFKPFSSFSNWYVTEIGGERYEENKCNGLRSFPRASHLYMSLLTDAGVTCHEILHWKRFQCHNWNATYSCLSLISVVESFSQVWCLLCCPSRLYVYNIADCYCFRTSIYIFVITFLHSLSFCYISLVFELISLNPYMGSLIKLLAFFWTFSNLPKSFWSRPYH